ncbi:MAG: hypothetical protein AAGG68_13540 [Bacteroidota bacterium]
MKTTMLFLSLFAFNFSFAQNNSGGTNLQNLIGEWEATNEGVQFPEIEKWKWTFESVMNGSGILFKSFLKMKDQNDWVQGAEAMMGGDLQTNKVYAFGIANNGMSLTGEGTYEDNEFTLNMYAAMEERPLILKMLHEVSRDQIIWKVTEYANDEPANTMNITYKRTK